MTLRAVKFIEDGNKEDDKWKLESTWSGDESQKIKLEGKIDKCEVSFTLTETDSKTERVSTKSFEGTIDAARIKMQGKWCSDEHPHKQNFIFSFPHEIPARMEFNKDGVEVYENIMIDLE